MTGYINYLDREPDPRLLRLRDIWDRLCDKGRLPVYTSATLAAFPEAVDHASLVEVQQDGKRRRYFVVRDGPAAAAIVGADFSGSYLDSTHEMPEFNTILISDYDGIVASRQPRLYAEEHHLDGCVRRIMGIQLPFASDGETIDWIVEFVFPFEE